MTSSDDRRPRPHAWTGALAFCLSGALAVACGPRGPLPPPELAADRNAPWPPWTTRGRFEEPLTLTFQVEGEGGPVDAALLVRAAERAAEEWNRTGLVRLQHDERTEAPTARILWTPTEGRDRAVALVDPGSARTDPFARGMRVLLDRDQAWTFDAKSAPSLVHVLSHELGHVLGLGHTERLDALMAPDETTRFDGPAPSDLAGLYSLYGPLEAPAHAGDLEILRAGSDTPVAPAVRGLALPGASEFALGDLEGDGDDELFVWRTDPAGQGTLLILEFVHGPRLATTNGPWVGMATQCWKAGPARTTDGRLVFLNVFEDGRYTGSEIRAGMGLQPIEEGQPLLLEGLPPDADGDGRLELDATDARALVEQGLGRRIGDLDGDHAREEIRAVGAE